MVVMMGFFSLQSPALVGFPFSHILLAAWADRIIVRGKESCLKINKNEIPDKNFCNGELLLRH